MAVYVAPAIAGRVDATRAALDVAPTVAPALLVRVRQPTVELDGEPGIPRIDKDLTAALLACALNADALLLLTDVDAVVDGFGTPAAHPIRHATPGEMRARSFPAGSMGPKVDACCRFVEVTGRIAAIGSLSEAEALLHGKAGTIISASAQPGWCMEQAAL